MSDEIYFKDPTTGELKPDKRKNDVNYTIAKLNKQQDDVDKELQETKALQKERFDMFEKLLNEKFNNMLDEIQETRSKNEETGNQLIEKFKLYYNSAMEKVKVKNDEQDNRIKSINIIVDDHGKRITKLEQDPVTKKASYWDKIFWAVVGVGGAVALNFLKNIIEALIR